MKGLTPLLLLLLAIASFLRTQWISDRDKRRHWNAATCLIAFFLVCSLVWAVQP